MVKWKPAEGVTRYHVYYSGAGITDKQVDNQLIRSYGDYFRADILALKVGRYTIKVVPVVDKLEGAAIVCPEVEVLALDRSGFAFNAGRVPGAYKKDGTLKDNAVVIYITEKSKNTIELHVTGATTNPCVGLQGILDGFKKGADTRPLAIRFVGTITDPTFMYNGDIVVENKSNASSYMTLEGVGNDAVLNGFGVRVKNATNIEIRNIGTMLCDSDEGDNISLQQDNSYVWVHHCDLFYGKAGGDADQAKGDGALDSKKSNFVTFSYNHFWDTGKSNLLGLSEGSNPGFISYHHNWYDHSDSRHPRVRYYSAHIYNNYYDGNSKYGIGSTNGSSLFVEKNVFRNCLKPMMISMQGTDTKMGTDQKDSPTFSKEDGGMIKAFDNQIQGGTFSSYVTGDPLRSVEFDAYVVSDRKEQLPASVVAKKGGAKYNNFDTNSSIMYDYTLHESSQVVDIVQSQSGRMMGGDFEFTFNNVVDDPSYAVNTPLMSKLLSYKTELVFVQDDAEGGNGPTPNPDPEDPEEPQDPTGMIVHNFIDGKASSFFTITGNMQSKPGTVTYGALTLTQCLKMESSTSITFTTTVEGSLTLVFDAAFSGKVKVDGVSHTAVNGVVTVQLVAGQHQISKGDTSNLYYIELRLDSSTAIEQPTLATISLYPNPASEYLIIETQDSILYVKIYNLSGVLVLQQEHVAGMIDLRSLVDGQYIIRVETTQGVSTELLIKR